MCGPEIALGSGWAIGGVNEPMPSHHSFPANSAPLKLPDSDGVVEVSMPAAELAMSHLVQELAVLHLFCAPLQLVNWQTHVRRDGDVHAVAAHLINYKINNWNRNPSIIQPKMLNSRQLMLAREACNTDMYCHWASYICAVSAELSACNAAHPLVLAQP